MREHITYRYHQLFAEILRDRLGRREPATTEAASHGRAWFGVAASCSRPCRHAVSAEETELLAAVLDDAGGWRMIPEGRMDTLVDGALRTCRMSRSHAFRA